MAEKELPTPEEMQEMAEIDIRTVDTSSLVDIEQVQIQTELPQAVSYTHLTLPTT